MRQPALRRLLTGYAVSGLGDWFGEIALSVVVFHATGSVLAVTALWIAGRIVPAIAGPPLVARLGRVRVPLLYAAEAAVFGILALAVLRHAPIPVLIALALLDGTLALAARALTKSAIVAAAEPAGVLAEANRMLGIVFGASMAVGPALAGIAVASVGPAAALALDGASFAAAGLLLARGRPSAPARGPRVSLRDAVARVRRSSTLSALLLVDGATGICFALILPVELVFVTETLGGSEADFGLVLAAWGAGAVLGGVVLGRLRDLDPGAVLLTGFAFMIAGYLGMGAAGGVGMVVVCSLLGGIGQGLEGCALLTAVQRRAPAELQAHVNAIAEAVRAAAPGVGFAIGGLLAATAQPRVTYIVAGLSALAVIAASTQTLSEAVAETGAFAPKPGPAVAGSSR
ncbi:MAG TPA: MFS transporter [Solirubrobacteraceae bacterium]|nr:MFS transporter [Solirubrobacteraceae bacterium]